jgi:exosortase
MELSAKSFWPAPPWLLPGIVLLTAWGLAIRQLALEWTINAQYQYGWIVPILTLILWSRIWLQRPAPGQPIAASTLFSVVIFLAIAAVPLRVIEEANPDWRVLNFYFMGQAILITALVIDYSGGKPWVRHFAFPLLFPLVAVPWPSGFELDVVQGLQRSVAAIGVEGASWLGWSAFQRGNLIVLPHGILGVNEACSGIRSLQSSLMISLFLGEYFQLVALRRWMLIVLALFLAFVLNVTRAFILIAVMDLHGATAMTQLHDPAGFGIAFVTLLLLWAGATIMARQRIRVPVPQQVGTGGLRFPLSGFAVLLLAWIGAEFLTQGWYLWHEQNTRPAPSWTLRWPPPRANFKEEEIDDVVRSYLRYDQGWHGEWDDQFHWDLFFFTWKPSRVAAGLAQSHRPDICLPAAGYVMKDDLGIKKMEIRGLVLPVQRYIFEDPSNGQLLYVFQVVTDDKINPDFVQEETEVPDQEQRLKAAWDGRRNPGQRSLLIVNQGATDLDQAETGVRNLLEQDVFNPE